MSGYRNDQFFNINKIGGEDLRGYGTVTTGNWNVLDANNPPFRFPDRTVRTYTDGKWTPKLLKRGYIRSMRTNVEGATIPIQKCQFQFNPATITQAVSLSTSLYDVYHQDPVQFAQPIPGGVNFNFELLFDRSMELNSTDFGGYDPLTGGVSRQFNEVNTWELSDPSEVGVLRDLGVFFATIGQGVSQATVEYQKALLGRSISLEAQNRESDALATEDVSGAISNSSDFLTNNLGNSAFLIPTPVRVVFSSLYIVEGIVQATSVEFLKFTTNYVPMVAKVTVDIEAKYIGFAKEKTYLQLQLDKEVEDYQQAQQEARDQSSALAASLNAGVGTVEMSLNGAAIVPLGSYPTAPYAFETMLTSSLSDSSRRYAEWFRIPNSQDDGNAVTKLFDDGSSVSLNVYPKIRVFGPFSGTTLSTAVSQDVLRSFTTGTPILSAKGPWDDVASTKDLWKKQARGWSSPSVVATAEFTSPELSGKYYVVEYSVSGTAVVDGTSVHGTGSKLAVFGPGLFTPTANFNQFVTLAWNTPTTIGGTTINDTSSTLAGDNKATEPPAEGSVSAVGSTSSTRSRLRLT